MQDFITIKEAAEKWDITARTNVSASINANSF